MKKIIKLLLLIAIPLPLSSCTFLKNVASSISESTNVDPDVNEEKTFHSVGEEIETKDGLIITLLGYTDWRGHPHKTIGPRFKIKNTNKTKEIYTLKTTNYQLDIDGYLYSPKEYYGSYYFKNGGTYSDPGIAPGGSENVEPNFFVPPEVYADGSEFQIYMGRAGYELYWKISKGENVLLS